MALLSPLQAFRGRLLALILLALGALLFIVFFNQVPIEGTSLALDWRGLWQSFQHFPPIYGNLTGLRIAPWDALLISPIGLLSFRASWGLLSFITMCVLVYSVPNIRSPIKKTWVALLLCVSFPSFRLLVDGNFEFFTILGVLLIVQGYIRQRYWVLALGLLLATAKEQETWLLMLALGFYLFKYWPVQKWLRLSMTIAVVVVPCLLWLGRDWINAAFGQAENGSIMDSSLWSTNNHLGLPLWATVLVSLILIGVTFYILLISGPTFSRQKAAMLISLSLLIAPYAAGNSFLVILAIGIISLLATYPNLAALLIALTNLPFFFSRDVLFNYSGYYWTAMYFLNFCIFGYWVWKNEVSVRFLQETKLSNTNKNALT